MKIGIIGAGISGLYAGHLLTAMGFDVTIFEASDRVGGRICSLVDGQKHLAELGAELVYAPNAPLIRLLKQMGMPIYPFQGDAYYHYQSQLVGSHQAQKPPQLNALLNTLDEIEDYRADEKPLDQFFREQPYYSSALANLVEGFACEYGTNADQLGTRSLAIEESTWSGGDEEFYMRQPMEVIVDYFGRALHDNILLGTCIQSVDYRGEEVRILDHDGREHIVDRVLVSVNLGVLKAQDIIFVPPLPDEKRLAIQSIGIDIGMKVIMKFSKQWWPKNLATIEGGECSYEYLASQNYGDPTLTAFVMGRQADAVVNYDEQQLSELLIGELDRIFGHKQASQSFRNLYVKNWGTDPLHKGAYSFPTPNSAGMRENLAEPVNDKLYFIGEACNRNGHAATIHGAMETAEYAVNKIRSEVQVDALV